MFIVPVFVFNNGILNSKGESNDMWTMSLTIFTSLVIVVNNKLILTGKMIDLLFVVFHLFTSYIPYFIFLYIVDSSIYLTEHPFTFSRIFGNPLTIFTMFFCVSFCFLVDYSIEFVSSTILKDPRDLLRDQVVNHKGKITKEFLEEFKYLSKVQKKLAL